MRPKRCANGFSIMTALAITASACTVERADEGTQEAAALADVELPPHPVGPASDPLDPCLVPFTFDEEGKLRSWPAACAPGSVRPWDPVERDENEAPVRPEERGLRNEAREDAQQATTESRSAQRP